MSKRRAGRFSGGLLLAVLGLCVFAQPVVASEPPSCWGAEVATPWDTALPVELECEGEPVEYEIVDEPENGQISELDPEAGTLLYTPNSPYEGFDSFSFSASNEFGVSEPAYIEIDVTRPYAPAGTPVHQFSFGGFGFGEGRFKHPADVEVGPEGHVFVLDSVLTLVQEFTHDGEFIDQWGDFGSESGQLDHPEALTFDGDGDIWIADTGNHRVQQFTSDGEYLSEFGSFGTGYTSYLEGHGNLKEPGGIAIDSDENVYVSDSGNNRVQKFTAGGEFLAIRTWRGETDPGQIFNPTPPNLHVVPRKIAVAPNGEVWYADHANIRVHQLSEDLQFLGGADQPPDLTYRHPDAVDVDSQGDVWIGDERHRIVRVDGEGNYLTQFGIWSGFPGGQFDFRYPFGIDVDSHNHIWITDPVNDRVQRWVEHSGQTAICEEASATTPVDQPLELKAGELGCEGDQPVSYELISGPEHGEISGFNPATGTLTYTPDSEYHGPDSFSFQASNKWGASDEMTFLLEVGVAPKCTDLKRSTQTNEALPIQLDCSGDFEEVGYEIVKGPSSGNVSALDAEEGTLTYTPKTGFKGSDKFTYRRSSWAHSSKATVTIGVCAPPTVEVGGSVANPEAPGLVLRLNARPNSFLCAGISSARVWIDGDLVYSETRDCEKGFEGCRGLRLVRQIQLPHGKVLGTHTFKVEAEDEFGNEAKDVVFSKTTEAEGTLLEPEAEISKEGKCRKPRQLGRLVLGTPCDDTIRPRATATVYRGLKGDDKIFGTGRTDKILGEDGADRLLGGRGSDMIRGGGDSDVVIAGSGDDNVRGNSGADTLNGGPGADRIRGNGGDDLVRGGATVDRLFGNEGDNTLSYADGVTPGFFLFPGTGPLTSLVTGFPGKHGERGVYVNLNGGAPFGDNGEVARYGGGTDKIRDDGFTHVIGTPFADLIIGSDEGNVIDAGAGTDIVRSGGGADQIFGGPDQDYLDGGAEGDAIDGGEGANDTCLDGTPSGACENSNPETTLAQPSGELLAVGILNAHSVGAESSVYLRGSGVNDKVSVSGGSGNVAFKAEAGGVFGESSGCSLKTENTEAECTGTDISSVLMYGGGGADQLEVNGFSKEISVTLLGGDGADRLIGGNRSEDTLVDGRDVANDYLKGKNGDDTLFASKGKDTLMGGGGEDLFVSAEVCDGDAIHGGSGNDNANWAQFAGAEIGGENYPEKLDERIFQRVKNGVNVRLAGGVIARSGSGCGGPEEKKGTIGGVENLEGSHGRDILEGNGFGNVLLGRAGPDVLRGRAGNDAILANNRNPTKNASAADKKDTDARLECGAGNRDVIKLDPADKKHFPLSQLKGCETKPKNMIQPAANYRVNEEPEETESQPGEVLDEEEIGGLGNPGARDPVAFFRLDEAVGPGAVDWTDPEAPEEGEEEELEPETPEEEEELQAAEEEEAEEEREESEESPQGPTLGTYEGSVALGQAGAMEESLAVELDGTEDHIDLTANWDPQEYILEDCGEEVAGYSVEVWVKFESEAAAREEIFSRSEGGEGLFLYRASDGTIKFSVAAGVESPTVSTDQPVDDVEWHHVVAMMAQRAEGCASLGSLGAITNEDLESLDSPHIALYVDGFPYALGTGGDSEGIIPEGLGSTHNIVGAKAHGSGYSNWLAATVDDVAIYGHPLSFEEVSEHLAISELPQPSVYLEQSVAPIDSDEDGVSDSEDNCAEAVNPEQEDDDIDGTGDACEPESDSDEDGVVDELDNCPDDANPLQEDLNENLVGDICEIVE